MKYNNSNKCANCDSDDLDYGCSEIHDDSTEFPYTCLNCNFKGSEWYTLVFCEHTETQSYCNECGTPYSSHEEGTDTHCQECCDNYAELASD